MSRNLLIERLDLKVDDSSQLLKSFYLTTTKMLFVFVLFHPTDTAMKKLAACFALSLHIQHLPGQELTSSRSVSVH